MTGELHGVRLRQLGDEISGRKQRDVYNAPSYGLDLLEGGYGLRPANEEKTGPMLRAPGSGIREKMELPYPYTVRRGEGDRFQEGSAMG